MVANALRHMVADRLELLEIMPAMQAWLCNAALAAWVPTSVERYYKLLAECRRFAEACGGHWDCPMVGLFLLLADWLKEEW